MVSLSNIIPDYEKQTIPIYIDGYIELFIRAFLESPEVVNDFIKLLLKYAGKPVSSHEEIANDLDNLFSNNNYLLPYIEKKKTSPISTYLYKPTYEFFYRFTMKFIEIYKETPLFSSNLRGHFKELDTEKIATLIVYENASAVGLSPVETALVQLGKYIIEALEEAIQKSEIEEYFKNFDPNKKIQFQLFQKILKVFDDEFFLKAILGNCFIPMRPFDEMIGFDVCEFIKQDDTHRVNYTANKNFYDRYVLDALSMFWERHSSTEAVNSLSHIFVLVSGIASGLSSKEFKKDPYYLDTKQKTINVFLKTIKGLICEMSSDKFESCFLDAVHLSLEEYQTTANEDVISHLWQEVLIKSLKTFVILSTQYPSEKRLTSSPFDSINRDSTLPSFFVNPSDLETTVFSYAKELESFFSLYIWNQSGDYEIKEAILKMRRFEKPVQTGNVQIKDEGDKISFSAINFAKFYKHFPLFDPNSIKNFVELDAYKAAEKAVKGLPCNNKEEEPVWLETLSDCATIGLGILKMLDKETLKFHLHEIDSYIWHQILGSKQEEVPVNASTSFFENAINGISLFLNQDIVIRSGVKIAAYAFFKKSEDIAEQKWINTIMKPMIGKFLDNHSFKHWIELFRKECILIFRVRDYLIKRIAVMEMKPETNEVKSLSSWLNKKWDTFRGYDENNADKEFQNVQQAAEDLIASVIVAFQKTYRETQSNPIESALLSSIHETLVSFEVNYKTTNLTQDLWNGIGLPFFERFGQKLAKAIEQRMREEEKEMAKIAMAANY